jgi:hypothetical protein
MDKQNYVADTAINRDGEQVPNVYIYDVKNTIVDRILELDSAGQLKWHPGIPQDEIWVKLVADKGDTTTKLGYQIVNTDNPNSADNTPLLHTFEGHDSYANLSECFLRYAKIFELVDGSVVLDKELRLFISGDCEFISRVYGISNASSKHPCFYCTASSVEMNVPNENRSPNVEPRTLPQIRLQNLAYIADGANPSRQKLFQNVVHLPIFDIPVERIVPPWLHVTLGMVLRLHCNLEKQIRRFPSVADRLIGRLEKVLSSKGIDRQTYHSNSFHGNACHRYLTHCRSIFEQLSEFICLYCDELSNKEIVRLNIVLKSFEALFVLYREIDNYVSGTVLMGGPKEICTKVHRFMKLYRRMHINVSLKTHIIEDHIVEFVRRFHVSLGLMGEQGIESAHFRFKYVKDRKTRDPLAKLLNKTRRYAIKTRVKN